MKDVLIRLIFHKFYIQSAIVNPCRMDFRRTFHWMTFACQRMVYYKELI